MDLKKISDEIKEIVSNRQKELNLSFVEDTHTYFMKNLQGEMVSNYPSVSTVLKSFYTPFDAESTKSFKNCGGDPEKEKSLLKEWSDSGTYASHMGSRVHFILEDYLVELYGAYKEVRLPIFECDDEQTENGDSMIVAGKSFLDLMHSRGAVLLDTEMVLGSPELGYTGQPDKVWLIVGKDGNPGILVTDWKGLPLDTPILTGSGWKSMGTLNKSDKVYDKDGDLVNIMNISQVKNEKCLKIKFDNNEEVVSDFEHRWLVYTESSGVKKERVMTTQEIKDYNDGLIKRDSYKILKISNPKPLNNPKTELPIDPYVLGMWLGDGHSIDAKITQANEVVWSEIKKRGYKVGNDVSQGGSGKATTRTIFDLQGRLRKTSLLSNKHIPEIYLSSSYEQRLDLLRGLMDSDGTYNKTRNSFVMETTRESQADYTAEIISSLGIKPTKSSFYKKFNGKIIKCYRTSFVTSEFNPFLSRNQDLVLNLKKDRRTYRTIVSVKEVESVPTKCIEVDSPSSTFLCGKSLLVTHNTNKPKNFVSQFYTKPMLTPFTEYDDTSLGHYYVQLPLYAKLLLNMLKGSKYENIPLLGGIVVLLKKDATFEEYRIPKEVLTIVDKMNVSLYLK